jgi:hypothetical protein
MENEFSLTPSLDTDKAQIRIAKDADFWLSEYGAIYNFDSSNSISAGNRIVSI